MNKKDTQEDGGGGGVGEDGEGRAAERNDDGNRSNRCGGNARVEGNGSFHCLLPDIAEAVEFLEEATVEDVQMKIEEMTSVKYKKRDLLLGLKNGIKLGLFDVARHFTVNSEQLNEELKKDKRDRRTSIASLIKRKLEERSIEMDGGDTDRWERNRFCGRKVQKKGKKFKPKPDDDYKASGRARERLCDRGDRKARARGDDSEAPTANCYHRKYSLKRKSSRAGSNSHRCGRPSLAKGESDGKRNRRAPSSQETLRSKGNAGKEGRRKKTPENSKLRVERNPLECRPPYYDIFT